MASDEINRIYSEDYADLFVSYNGEQSVIDKYKENGIDIINFFLAITHYPISKIEQDMSMFMGYAAIPSLFGLTNESGLEKSGITRLRNIPNFNLRGKGVLIGFVDTGIDYTNPIFQNADKTTRIARIWDQTIISDKQQAGIVYGTEYTREQINEAIKSDTPLQIVPTKDDNGHGTMVAGIAAGNEVPEKSFYGVAPDAELVIVKLKPAKKYLKKYFFIQEDAICYQENDLIFGIQYLLNYSAQTNQPLVICITCDTSQYAHDGRGTTSGWLTLQASYTGTAIFLPVGNEGNYRRHYNGNIKETPGFDIVELNVGSNENGFSIELWGNSPNIFSIDILSPSGEYIPRIDIKFNESREVTFIFDPTIIHIHYEIMESQSGDQLILLRFDKPSKGVWKFKVYGRGLFPMYYNMWLPMNGFISSDTFFIRSNPNITLLSLSCAITPITVTAYNVDDDNLYTDAGRGYTRIDTIKPEIAAPGVNILAPDLNHEFTQVTGTSVATAHAAGVGAMLLEWGIISGHYPMMSTQDMKVFMIRGARRNISLKYPNPDWGYGILDIFNVFDILRSSEK